MDPNFIAPVMSGYLANRTPGVSGIPGNDLAQVPAGAKARSYPHSLTVRACQASGERLASLGKRLIGTGAKTDLTRRSEPVETL